MNYNFFASKSDKINLLSIIFNEANLRVFDLYSPYDQAISEYKSIDEILARFDLVNGGQSAVTFQLWSPRHKGMPIFRRIELDPRRCNGSTFRYSTEGWGLIQLYFGGEKDNTLYHSHIGHFNERGALGWEGVNKEEGMGKVDEWDWKEIARTSRKLKNQLHGKIAVRSIGSYGILPGANDLSNNGVKLWGTVS